MILQRDYAGVGGNVDNSAATAGFEHRPANTLCNHERGLEVDI